MTEFYFSKFEDRTPPSLPPPSKRIEFWWHCAAGVTLGLGFWYLCWRWTHSINIEALWFSLAVLLAETCGYIGCLLFFHDIWRQGDTRQRPPPTDRKSVGLFGGGATNVDIFITTYDEDPALVALTVHDAKSLIAPPGVHITLHILDDGNRQSVRNLARESEVKYITRTDNHGFKAGNLRNALLQTSGDFFVICDSDTRLFPAFLQNTLGYFRDHNVAWVQTPHWFYDIPEGKKWLGHSNKICNRIFPGNERVLRWISGSDTSTGDPFLSDPGLFFDIIQRRRNRSGASFCCGAGSVHRREAIFSTALSQFVQETLGAQKSDISKNGAQISSSPIFTTELQPFRFHVSEDIYTSILLHSDCNQTWTSVYHPKVECKMLSPWDMTAWTAQRSKYAAGTFDIILRANPLLKRGMPLKTRLHYAATFWSYLSSLWQPVLLVAPIITLTFGVAPVTSFSGAFFLHLVPFLLANELALILGCWGQDVQKGRSLAIACIPINICAFFQALGGQTSEFKPTPKNPMVKSQLKTVAPHLTLISITVFAVIFGIYQTLTGTAGYSSALIIVNVFWACWNIYCMSAAPRAAFWRKPLPATVKPSPAVLLQKGAHVSI